MASPRYVVVQVSKRRWALAVQTGDGYDIPIYRPLTAATYTSLGDAITKARNAQAAYAQ